MSGRGSRAQTQLCTMDVPKAFTSHHPMNELPPGKVGFKAAGGG